MAEHVFRVVFNHLASGYAASNLGHSDHSIGPRHLAHGVGQKEYLLLCGRPDEMQKGHAIDPSESGMVVVYRIRSPESQTGAWGQEEDLSSNFRRSRSKSDERRQRQINYCASVQAGSPPSKGP
jgi:hypothetical protein